MIITLIILLFTALLGMVLFALIKPEPADTYESVFNLSEDVPQRGQYECIIQKQHLH